MLENEYAVHRFLPDVTIPAQIFTSSFYNISKTRDELSIVCNAGISIPSDNCEKGWSCIQVAGPLDFSLTGILADISAILARNKISIFALSTYDTDYILVKTKELEAACRALTNAGHCFK